MKTAFATGDQWRQIYHTFYYHGILMQCYKPGPGQPYIYIPINPPPPEWVLIGTYYPNIDDWYYLYYDITQYPPSTINDPCDKKFPDGKKHWYKMDYDIYVSTTAIGEYLNNGAGCQLASGSTETTHRHSIREDTIWAGSNIMYKVYKPTAPSKILIYASSTGERPP